MLRLRNGPYALLTADLPVQIALGRLGASALGLLSAPLLARALGPDGRGVTAAALATFFLVPVLMAAGMPLEVRRRAALDGGAPALRAARAVSLALVLPSLGLGLLASATVFASLSHPVRVTLVAGVTASPLMVGWMCDQSVLIARQRFRMVALMQVAQPAVLVAGVVGLWAADRVSVPAVLCASLAGTGATAVLGAIGTSVSPRGERAQPWSLWRGSLRYAGSAVAEAAANRLDQVLALPLLGAAQAGLYSVAVTLGAVPLTLGHALGASVFSEVSTAAPAARRALTRTGMRQGLALGTVVCLASAASTPLVVPWLFGDAFAAAVPATQVAFVGSAVAVAAYVGSMGLAADGRGWSMTVAQVGGLGAGIALLLLLGPRLGALGAAAASSAGFLCLFGVLSFVNGGSWRDVLVGRHDLRSALLRVLTPRSAGRPTGGVA